MNAYRRADIENSMKWIIISLFSASAFAALLAPRIDGHPGRLFWICAGGMLTAIILSMTRDYLMDRETSSRGFEVMRKDRNE